MLFSAHDKPKNPGGENSKMSEKPCFFQGKQKKQKKQKKYEEKNKQSEKAFTQSARKAYETQNPKTIFCLVPPVAMGGKRVFSPLVFLVSFTPKLGPICL